MSKELNTILAESMLFREFSQKQIEEVIMHMQPKMITRKSWKPVYKKGDIADRCWLIESGSLMLKKASLRSPFRHMVYARGSVTGIQGLVDPGSRRVVSMVAENKVKLVEITHEGVERLNNELQILLWKNIARILTLKLAICFSQESFND